MKIGTACVRTQYQKSEAVEVTRSAIWGVRYILVLSYLSKV